MAPKSIAFRPHGWKVQMTLIAITVVAQLATIVTVGLSMHTWRPGSAPVVVVAGLLLALVSVRYAVLNVEESSGDRVTSGSVRASAGLPNWRPTYVTADVITAVRPSRAGATWYVDVDRCDGVELRLYHSSTGDVAVARDRARAVASILGVPVEPDADR